MGEKACFAAVGAWFLIGLFFWGRGILKGRTGDLIAGGAILAALCAFLWVTTAFFDLIGGMLAATGLATLIMSPWASPSGRLRRADLVALGMGFLILGACLAALL